MKSGPEPKSKTEPKSKSKAKVGAKSAEAGDKSPKRKEQRKQKAKASKEKADEAEDAKAAPPKATGVKTAGKLLLLPNSHWYTALASFSPSAKPLPTPSASQISSLIDKAAQLLHSDASAYQASSAFTGNSASDSHFLNTILSKGTLSDRLSALTLLVQASPVHNTKALETLKGMAERGRGKGGRDEGLKAMRCVVDWWVGGGAPGRKLKYDGPLLRPRG